MRLISSPPWGGMRWLVEAVKCEASWILACVLSTTFIVFDWRYSAHILVNSRSSPISRSSNEGGKLVLPCPEPILFPIDFHPRFVSTNNPGIQNTLPDHFISICTLECQPVQQTMQSPFTNCN